MRLTRQAALAIALACGLLAALLVWVWMTKQTKPAPKVAEQVQIPVPLKAIPAQTDLRPEMFTTLSVARDKVTSDVVTTETSFQGRLSLVQLPAGVPVRASQIAVRSASLGLAYVVPAGLRGMAIAVDIIDNVADFVQPGSHVDIMVSFERQGQVVVRTVVQNVLVLAVNNNTSVALPTPAAPTTPTAGAAGGAQPAKEPPKDAAAARKPEIPITLALTPLQAQQVTAADVAGKLRLVLRAIGDKTIVPLPPANSWSMIGALPGKKEGEGAPQQPSATTATPQPGQAGASAQGAQNWGGRPATAPKPKQPTIEVIRGGQRETITPAP